MCADMFNDRNLFLMDQADSDSRPILDRSMTAAQWEGLLKAAGDSAQLGEYFGRYRDRLKRIVSAAMDQRVQGRMDASDVIQETFLEAFARINEYLQAPKVSLFIWLRFLAKQRLAMMHRHHLNVQARDIRRDLPLQRDDDNRRSAEFVAAQLAARLTSASATLTLKELKREIHLALNNLDEKSREILTLRHFEQLSNLESAEVLQVSPTAACNRYVRALERLKRQLNILHGPEINSHGSST